MESHSNLRAIVHHQLFTFDISIDLDRTYAITYLLYNSPFLPNHWVQAKISAARTLDYHRFYDCP
nr:MAG: VP2 protein [Drosophila Crammond virga-like virus]